MDTLLPSLFNQSGENWSVTHTGGRTFILRYEDRQETYVAVFEPFFGLDIHDKAAINNKLDEMEREVRRS